MSVTKTVIESATSSWPSAPLEHGGDLGLARTMFPAAPEPFVDLSTGINPFAYPMPPLASEIFARLPESAQIARLAAIAAKAYGAPSADHVVVAAGTQSLLGPVFSLVPAGAAAILSPTYAEHARVATLVGHQVAETAEFDELKRSRLAIVVNPNNPDGSLVSRQTLLSLADQLRTDRGLLVVDEAFMDVGPQDTSLVPQVGRGAIVVLRSFGKFFGLAGVRLGFALAAPEMADRLRSLLGPWVVSGPAIAAGASALANRDWIDTTRVHLATAAMRLDALLHAARLQVMGGTSLFRTVRTPDAALVFFRLGQAGILVRRFSDRPDLLRFGLPGEERAWERLRAALLYDNHGP